MSLDATVFSFLFHQLDKSGCAKKHTACATFIDGVMKHTVNFCEFIGEVCPRLNMPSGQGYELCKAHHAEANLASILRDAGETSDGVAWLVGHYWACEPCASALKSIGIKELRIREFPRASRADGG